MVGKQEDGGTVTTGTNPPVYTTAIISSSTQSSHTSLCSAALPPEDPQPGPSTPVISTKDEVIVETSDGGLFLLSRCRLAAESHFFRALFHGTYLESKSSRVSGECFYAIESTEKTIEKELSTCLSLVLLAPFPLD
ncbi:hypothetical protein Y032_0045g1218 [Ancylostoma ceylanicum]|uniref:BTB domain-containing protein n=1 Tax=Ancylostoma ceylanicum TaxID=53326 RepID=A0A016UDN8_9BILA|nr:hypothetical protein Y032_0045g1218 [Ancylostoma ceylanicum]